jgi:ABC-type dipeptide/oligopeptide/nickel transport system permease subunit
MTISSNPVTPGMGANPHGDEPVSLDASLGDVSYSRSLMSDAWRRFRRNKLALFGLFLVALLLLVAVFGPMLVGDPLRTTPIPRARPSREHLFGTDQLGRDVFARTVHGIRLSLFIGFLVVVLETLIGVLVGALAGWFKGIIDTVLMRIVDILLGIPYLILALALVAVLGRGVSAVIVTLALTAWLPTARTVRAGFLQVRGLEYVEAARTVGVSTWRTIWRHVLPNTFQPIVVLMAVGVGAAILSEAALSFLGVGVQEPQPSLGLMISRAQSFYSTAPHLLFFPGFAIVITVLGFLLVGDGLRDAFDVKDT